MPEHEKLYDTTILIQTHQADMEFVKHMVTVFLEHMPESNANLIKASNENDWGKVYFYAHKMKASIDLFNLIQLKDLIRVVEKKAKSITDTDTIAADVNFISNYIQNCMTEMKEDFGLK